jgi:hypothetical protein
MTKKIVYFENLSRKETYFKESFVLQHLKLIFKVVTYSHKMLIKLCMGLYGWLAFQLILG